MLKIGCTKITKFKSYNKTFDKCLIKGRGKILILQNFAIMCSKKLQNQVEIVKKGLSNYVYVPLIHILLKNFQSQIYSTNLIAFIKLRS